MHKVLLLEPLALRRAIDVLAFASEEDVPAITSISEVPIGFSELAWSGTLSFEVIKVTLPLNDAAKSANNPQTLGEGFLAQLSPTAHELSRLLISDLSSLELQVSCALAAFVLQICQLHSPATHPELATPTFPLEEIAQAFTNKKNHRESPVQRNALIWSCVVLASSLLDQRDQSLKGKGHVIFVSLTVLLEEGRQLQTWDSLEPILRQFLWHDALATDWKRTFEACVWRQKYWEDRGYLAPGVPHGSGPDGLVEYFVLRAARSTLPKIEDD